MTTLIIIGSYPKCANCLHCERRNSHNPYPLCGCMAPLMCTLLNPPVHPTMIQTETFVEAYSWQKVFFLPLACFGGFCCLDFQYFVRIVHKNFFNVICTFVLFQSTAQRVFPRNLIVLLRNTLGKLLGLGSHDLDCCSGARKAW